MNQSQRKEYTRAAIVDAAVICLSQKSADDITMDNIAELSGLSKRTIYRYFPSKGALIAGIFEKSLEELCQRVQATLSRCVSLPELLQQHYLMLSEFTRKNSSFMKMLWTPKDSLNFAEIPDDVMLRIDGLDCKLKEMVAGFIADFELTGFFEKYAPNDLVDLVSALNKGIFLQSVEESKIGLDGPSVAEMEALAVDSLLCCLKAK